MRKPTDAMARARGAFVGCASGAVSIAAHALAGGSVAVGQSGLALLIAACAAVGYAVAAMRNRYGIAEVMALLAGGQAIGHTALSVAPEHHHGGGANQVMLAAHLVAIPLGAILIRGAERAIARLAGGVRRAVAALDPLPAVAVSTAVTAWQAPARAPRSLLGSGIGRRGPPVSR
ncbi:MULTISPECIES: hypothetical protein [unclassified Nocardia]|uniref:hypothetical protein n=1 Tax=unclassified Nocardia TaxID=2637762 RepID=UPI001CE444BB|nr:MULTISPECIES: hypothetical protein [unclassified Nocardia]